MHQPNQSPTGASAIHTLNQEALARAFSVVDAVDDLQGQLGAYRAVAQLADSDRHGAEGLPQLRRADLAQLFEVLNSNLETHCIRVRTEAMSLVDNPPSGANPV